MHSVVALLPDNGPSLKDEGNSLKFYARGIPLCLKIYLDRWTNKALTHHEDLISIVLTNIPEIK